MAQAAGWIRTLARYQLIGHLLPGRKVLELGCEAGRAADELADRGAEVFGFESTRELERGEGEARGRARLGAGDPYRLHFAAGAFDIVLVPELTRWTRRRQLLNEVRRVLRADGLALICARCDSEDPAGGRGGAAGRRALSHDQLVRSLRGIFPHVRVYGDMPFSGRILADFAPPGPPEPELDCSLVDQDQDPTHLLALCAAGPVDPLGYVVVQLPAEEVGAVDPAEQLDLAPERPVADVAWAEGLVAQLERQTARAEHERTRADQDRAALMRQGTRLSTLRERLEAAERTTEQFGRTLDQQQRRAEAAESRCDLLVDQLGRGARDHQSLETRVAELKAARAEDEWRIDELKGRVLAAENALSPGRERGSALPTFATGAAQSAGDDAGGGRSQAEVEQLRDKVRRLEVQLVGVSGPLAELEQLRLDARKRREQDQEFAALKSELGVTRRELSHAKQSLQKLDTVETELRRGKRKSRGRR